MFNVLSELGGSNLGEPRYSCQHKTGAKSGWGRATVTNTVTPYVANVQNAKQA